MPKNNKTTEQFWEGVLWTIAATLLLYAGYNTADYISSLGDTVNTLKDDVRILQDDLNQERTWRRSQDTKHHELIDDLYERLKRKQK